MMVMIMIKMMVTIDDDHDDGADDVDGGFLHPIRRTFIVQV